MYLMKRNFILKIVTAGVIKMNLKKCSKIRVESIYIDIKSIDINSKIEGKG